jgi:tRNA-specific adenosine deaminase 2
VPIGCVIVDAAGKVVAKGRNRTNETRNATRHAEFEALDILLSSMDASEIQVKMAEFSLYVTIEPCIMCAAALRRVGLLQVYFGSYNERFGGCGSIIPVHDSYLVDPPLNITLLEEWRSECVGLLRMFYMRENERAPVPRKKTRRVLKPVL